ncbi:MAG: thioredoxin domain-containing protein [Hyphomonadaceae bacterium]|nr:thioredoxin domain-containing protein [Hyphomonadaceae bacterium]
MLADRRHFIATAAALGLLAACGGAAGGASAETGDIVLGRADAPVTMIEYASTMCPACADFHARILPQIKANYVDTGKVKFIFREFATEPREFAYAGFMMARCVGSTPEKYHEMIAVLFQQQRAIFESARIGQGREKLLEIARTAGMSEEQFSACVTDPAGIERIRKVEAGALEQFKLTGTPTIIIDGEVIPNTIEAPYSYESLAARIDARAK